MIADDGVAGDRFGYSVAISENFAIVGAWRDNDKGRYSGSAYIFRRNGNQWLQQEPKLPVEYGKAFDECGWSVAMSGNDAIVGCYNNAAYIYNTKNTKLPLVFIPGVAGSELTEGDERLWLPPNWRMLYDGGKEQIMRLSLFPYDNPSKHIVATDVIRYPLPPTKLFSIYGKLLDYLTDKDKAGYIAYDLHMPPEKGDCDLRQISDDPEQNPNLFIFPYDWRQDLGELAQRLDKYIQCIQQFHPGEKVNILTHSMGSLVARRYILDSSSDPNDVEKYHNVEKLITSGAPWLGAPKTLHVANTGDIGIVGMNKEAVEYIVEPMAPTYQVSPGWYYHRFHPAFEEFGWDIDKDGIYYEDYAYEEYLKLLDYLYRPPSDIGTPSELVDEFHSGDQDDWSYDDSGIQYFHIYGLQHKLLTFVKLRTTENIFFSPLPGPSIIRKLIEPRFGEGDGTVPLISLQRQDDAHTINYNAPLAKLCEFSPSRSSKDGSYNHNFVNNQGEVHTAIDKLLRNGDSADCEEAYPQSPTQSSVRALLKNSTQDDSSTSEPAKYLTLVGVRNVVVIDEFGRRSDTLEDLEELDAYVFSIAEDVVTIAMGTQADYTIIFEVTEGFSLKFTMGIGNEMPPTQAIRYLDVDLPSGVNAMLLSPAEGIGLEWLRYDGDGDRDFEGIVQPTAEVTGDAAKDITPPSLSTEATEQASKSIITLSAKDGDSGVKAIYYSLDRISFQPYKEPFDVDPVQYPTIYAVADDNVANRSRLFEFELNEIPAPTPTPEPTATPVVSPPPTETPVPAVPEPSSFLLLGIGVIGLLGLTRKIIKKR
ncbi:MAG: PEP-CTERM sorting domain-containing protein [bacterium]|nr:PEP-CTERM sorting domain-containing protein [bacterium]